MDSQPTKPNKNEETKPQLGEDDVTGRAGKRKLIVERFPNETEEAFDKRRKRVYKQRFHASKKLREAKKRQAMTIAQERSSNFTEDDFFIRKVAGVMSVDPTKDSWTKYEQAKMNVGLRVNISQVLERVDHIELKRKKQKVIRASEYLVGFHVDELDVDDPKCSKNQDKVWALPTFPWLRIKKSQIPGAGHGCYSERNFAKGDIIGLYMGGKKGEAGYSIMPNFAQKPIKCYSICSNEAQEERSAKTMGLQMINDPSFNLEEGEEPLFVVNVECMSDMLVQAIKDIKKGEELFMDYDMTDCPSDQDSGDNEKSDGQSRGFTGPSNR